MESKKRERVLVAMSGGVDSSAAALLLRDAGFDACGVTMKGDKAMQMVHTIHCYLFGEVAIFLAGRGLIREEQAFRRYVVAQCAEQAAALLSRR